MPKSRKHRKTSRSKTFRTRSRKQKLWRMRGCSLEKTGCPKCGPNCRCGPNCNCPHKCPGNCYLNKQMKGGQGCGTYGCPIAPFSIKGGCAGMCPLAGGKKTRSRKWKKGGCDCGKLWKGGNPVPAPLVNQPWGPKVSEWPGTGTVPQNHTYLANNLYDKGDPQTAMKLYSGGGFVPQQITNLGRDLMFNLKTAYNSVNGIPGPVNPAPYKDQLVASAATRQLI